MPHARTVTIPPDVLAESEARLSRLAAEGKRCIGYFCTYAPLELIHAAGFVPVRVRGGRGVIERADALAPAFTCPFMRLSLERLLAGGYDFLTGMVQAYTCDAACGMLEIWKEHARGSLFASLPLPYNDNPESRRYLRAALTELGEKLKDIGGLSFLNNLGASLELYQAIRLEMMRLYRLRREGALSISPIGMLSLAGAFFEMRPEEFLAALIDASKGMHEGATAEERGVPVLVSGSVIDDPEVFAVVQRSGGRIVGDDLCTGFRSFDSPAGEGRDPLDRLVDRYMKRPPCPSRARAEERVTYIRNLAAQSGARGVVFLFQKFCAPHLADHPHLSRALREAGIPSIAVELTELGASEGQIATRLEGFFEMLGTADG